MEEIRKKCSSNKHKDIDAISYCKNCKLYLCNKCRNMHSEFYDNHNLIMLDKDPYNIFTNECSLENHDKLELNYFCKDHNILCCAYCVNKINNNGYGEHFECDFCHINDIKEEKENKLRENIILLEDLSKNIDNMINELKTIIEKQDSAKDNLKLNIQKLFTKIRSSLNEKEDKLLLEVEEIYKNESVSEEIIKESEKLKYKIKRSLEKGKSFDKELNDINLSSFINDCILIENNIKEINKINDIILNDKTNKNKIIKFEIKEDTIGNIIEQIDNIGYLSLKNEDIKKDFDKNLNQPLNVLNYHKNEVWCLTYLKDGRLVSSSNDNTIIIYNKETFIPDLRIKEHSNPIYYVIQLSSGLLASCSCDNTIKLFKISGNKYEVVQTLNYHHKAVFKLLELKNNNLVSCSDDGYIIFYKKDKLTYKYDYSITTNYRCSSVIQTKDNEICYSLFSYQNEICFYDFLERKNKALLANISKCNNQREWFIMITKDLLLIPGKKMISIININEYKLIRIIDVPNSEWLCGACMLNKNEVIIGDDSKIIQWRIEGDNLNFVSQKEKAHDGWINVLLNIGNGHIASGSDDKTIKIW